MVGHSRTRTDSARISPACLKRVQAYLHSRRRHEKPPPEAQQAWDEFYAFCDPLLRRFACCLQQHDRDDCVQKCWVKLYLHLPRIQFDATNNHLERWLFTLVRSNVVDLHRARMRHQMDQLTRQLESKLIGDEQRQITERDVQRRQRRALRLALAKLQQRISALNFRAFQMRWIEGYSITKIARTLKLSRSRVWWRDFRMRRKFRALYRLELALGRDSRIW
jgi:RNA polymerase sigma factor (sigma-70 family)